MSATVFCRQNQIAVSSFFAWKRRLRSTEPHFVEVKATEADGAAMRDVQPSSEGIEVLLHGGRRIRVRSGFDRALLGEIVAALESLPGSAS
jgi:hypothetical protein